MSQGPLIESFGFSRAFYQEVDEPHERIAARGGGDTVMDVLKNRNAELIPFRNGKVAWLLMWE